MKRILLSALGIALLILLPLGITVTAIAYAYRTSPVPQELHRASVVFKPPSTVQESASAVNLFIADFGEQIRSDPILHLVLEEVPGLNESGYLRDIEAERRGITSSIALSFVHSDKGVAQATVDVVAGRLLDDAARGEFERTQFLLGRASERLEMAQQAVDEFYESELVFDPDFEYRNAVDQVAQLNQQITTGRALSYGETYLGQLEAERDRIDATLPSLGAAMLTLRRLLTDLQLAQGAWEQATVNNDSAEFNYLTVDTVDNLIASREVALTVDETPRLQRTALAGVVALALSLLIVTPISNRLRRSGRRGKHKLGAEAEPSSDLTVIVDTAEDPAGQVRTPAGKF